MIYKLAFAMSGVTAAHANVDTDNVLGRGGDATVYKASVGGRPFAAKIFYALDPSGIEKVSAMISNPPTNLTGETAGRTYPKYAWPTSLLLDAANQPVGFLMPLIDLAESFTLDHYYDKNHIKKLNAPEEVALSYKLEIAANLSALIADLHRHEHYFIDFKPQNIRVFKTRHAVTLVDCDGFSIGSAQGIRHPARLLTTDYWSPEAFNKHTAIKDLGVEHDQYALAVIIFQLLNAGIHPFQGILADRGSSASTNDEKAAAGLYPYGRTPHPKIKPRPQSIHECFDDQTRTLFDKAFTGSPKQRPSAEEWAKHLQSILDNKMLGRCEAHSFDIRHMRFAGKQCPACFLNDVEKNGAIIVPKTVIDKSKLHIPVDVAPVVSNLAVPGIVYPNKPENLKWGRWVAALIILGVFLHFISNPSPPPAQQPQPSAQTANPERTSDYSALIKKAETGDAVAQHYLGMMYLFGKGAPQDFAKAFEWVQKAAMQGNAPAQTTLGWAYMSSEFGLLPDYQLAMEWNLKAAKQGFGRGTENVGLLYENGWGVPVNYLEAAHWYKAAIDQGADSGQAQFHLGELYEKGRGIQKNPSEALNLYRIVVEKYGNSEYAAKAKIRLAATEQVKQGYSEEKVLITDISKPSPKTKQGKQNYSEKRDCLSLQSNEAIAKCVR